MGILTNRLLRTNEPYLNATLRSIMSSLSNKWQKTEIYRYQDEIPEFVLRKALQIKQRVPSVEFFIEHIGVRHDPFLIVRYKTQEYYVEVWAEPKFESEFFK